MSQAGTIDRKISYCIFTYNQEKFIGDCINGALRQKHQPHEIIVSDDCSTDQTYKVACNHLDGYWDKSRVVLRQTRKNLGIGAHVSDICNNLATGDYIITIGGDDISFENHVEEAYNSIIENADMSVIDFNGSIIDERGKFVRNVPLNYDKNNYDIFDYLRLKDISSFAPGRVFKKELFQNFPAIPEYCPTEDSVIILRGLLCGGICRLNKTLVKYRIHGDNLSIGKKIAKISHKEIVNQYKRDIIFAYQSGLIGKGYKISLLRRIRIERVRRMLRYGRNASGIKKSLISTFLNLYMKIYLRTNGMPYQ